MCFSRLFVKSILLFGLALSMGLLQKNVVAKFGSIWSGQLGKHHLNVEQSIHEGGSLPHSNLGVFSAQP